MKKVKIKSVKEPYELKISCDKKAFDTARIDKLSVNEFAFPFHKGDVDWKGLYEELKEFTGDEEFIIQFEGEKEDFDVLKYALANSKAKLVSSKNTVVILYSENPYTTKISINGDVMDTAKIQNRSIEEWIKPIELRGIEWKGVFKELEEQIGTDEYDIQFMGEQEHMKPLMDACPVNVNVSYRMALNQERGGSQASGSNANVNAGGAAVGAAAGAAIGGASATAKKGFADVSAKVLKDTENMDSTPMDTSNLNWTGLLLIFIGNIIDLFIGFGFILSLIGMIMLSTGSEIFRKARNEFIKSLITSIAGAIVLLALGMPLLTVYVMRSATSLHDIRIAAAGVSAIIWFIILVAAINIAAYIFNSKSYRYLMEGCRGIAIANSDTILSEKCVKAYRHYKIALLLVTILTIAFSIALLGIASLNIGLFILGMIIWFAMIGTQIYLLVAKILIIINVWKTYKYKDVATL